jgi:hypothetical protein
MMWLLRRLPPETAHNLSLWALRTGLWRVALVLDALLTLCWTVPLIWLIRRLTKSASVD